MQYARFLVAVFFFIGLSHVAGHGRLRVPSGRASMWRDGYDTVPDYNDNELFCGGFKHQWEVNRGLCGICGDPYDGPYPHEAPGGPYASGIIVEDYKSGQWIDVSVEVTTAHLGYWEFKICPNDNIQQDPDQDCFDRIGLLPTSGGSENYPLNTWDERFFHLKVKLPDNVTCEQCIFQWKWITGNSWGVCEDGSEALGCGPQETFMGCADVKISS
ncbi:hypothetical protein TCAL_10831 [Tigriopus californicus]|uniref:Chitin-binding type-4 domain-containing protein n=1 Tax=Tigriopus californicus TaxID=6832 RepID=A0A553P082_TIGCA|nr:hypothetical protein TCAL_10831 [Tigriopus californicus]